MVGLQGSGKTTSTAKIAKRLTDKDRKKVMMASLDVARPAAQEQLAVLGEQVSVATLPIVQGQQPVDIARRALELIARIVERRQHGATLDRRTGAERSVQRVPQEPPQLPVERPRYLLAFVYGYLGDHDLLAARTEAEKYLLLGALNLAECVAFVGSTTGGCVSKPGPEGLMLRSFPCLRPFTILLHRTATIEASQSAAACALIWVNGNGVLFRY